MGLKNVENNNYTSYNVQDAVNFNKSTAESLNKEEQNQKVTELPEENLTIGNAINELIKIDTDSVLEEANKLSTCNQNIIDEFENLMQEIRNLENNWTSNASSNAISSFETIKTNMSSRGTEMSNYISILTNVVAPGYEDTETRNSSLADAFK